MLTMRPRAVTRCALWLALSVLSGGCGRKPAPETEPVVPVQAVRVERSEVAEQVTAEAVLYPLHQATIVPKITAPIRQYLVSRGAHVHAGQLLAQLENNDLTAAVAENKGAYEQAQANYEKTTAANLPEQIQSAEAAVTTATASLKAAGELYEEAKRLYQAGALAGKQVNDAEVAFTQARTQLQTNRQQLENLRSVGGTADVRAAQGQLDSAKGKYDGAQAELAYSEVESPIDGVVAERPLDRGEMASMSAPLAIVMDISHVIARAHMPVAQASLLKPGDAATISTASTNQKFPAAVMLVSPALDPGNTTVQVWVEAANPREELKAGAAVTVTVTARTVPDALVIPKSALVSSPGEAPFAMAIGPDSLAHRTPVKTGIEQGDRIQVTHGLREGQLVVSQGAYGLPDGTKVEY